MNGVNFNLSTKNIPQIFNKIKHTHNKYITYFRSKTHNAATQSFQYIQGKFIKQGRGNMVKYSKILQTAIINRFIMQFPIPPEIIDQYSTKFKGS